MASTEHDGQQIFRLLAEAPKLRTFTDAELRICKSYTAALRRTVEMAGKNRDKIEAAMGIQKFQMSKILGGSHGLGRHWQKFYEACGNIYGLQWELYQLGFSIHRREFSVEEKAALFDELMQQKLA